MRRSLDLLYRLSGALAALFLVAICGVVVLQVGANILDAAFKAVTGAPLGFVVPSYAEFTGYFLVGASFLALAYSLRAGSHIRVSLLIRGLGSGARRWIELWCTASGALLSAYFAWFSIEMVVESYQFNDLSSGIVPVPVWLPQATMPLGLIVFAIALIDEFAVVLGHQEPTYVAGDAGEFPGPQPLAAETEDRT
jgi:TRAP-type C4-dicarboxylate transport system permease small subunit